MSYACTSNVLSWYSRAPWAIRCDEVAYACERLADDLVMFRASGCGEEAAALIYNERQPVEADSVKDVLEKVLSGRAPRLRSDCAPEVEVRDLRVVNSGLRSTVYELRLNGAPVHLKVMRRLETDNIEHVVLRYLSRAAKDLVPQYVCSVTYDGRLLMLAAEAVDGEPAATYFVSSAKSRDLSYIRQLSQAIGARVARLHVALLGCDEDWCRPEPVSESDVSSWLGRISWRSRWLRDAGAKLVQEGRSLVVEAADALDELRGAVSNYADELVGRTKLRVHGDLHLYQIMVDGGRLVLTDFEGEPYRMPASKLEKEPLIRDLAALARSIDYAAVMGAQAREGISVSEASSWLDRATMEWEVQAFRLIYDSYVNELLKARGDLAGDVALKLMAFWLVERASYEAVYEIVARTGYHFVPLNAIIRMADGKDPIYNTSLGSRVTRG